MKKWLSEVFHAHLYEVYKEENIVNDNDKPIGKVVILKCKICGNLKTHKYLTNIHYM